MQNSTPVKLRAAVIGVGSYMQRVGLPALEHTGRFSFHRFCDQNPDNLASAAGDYHPHHTSRNADDVFNDADVDVLFIGTRSNFHCPLLLDAIRANKPVFVEKPMTMTEAETEQVLDVARGRNPLVGVDFNRRYAPSIVSMKSLFDRVRSGPSQIHYRIMDDHRIRPEYIFNMEDGGGHLLQEGCHIFDLLSWFLDSKPVLVFARGPLETDNAVLIEFADGSLATIACGGKGSLFYPKECFEVFNNGHSLALDHFLQLRCTGELLEPDEALQWFGRDELPEGMDAVYRDSFARQPRGDVDPQKLLSAFKLSANKGHREILHAFADAVQSGKPFPVGVEAGAMATIVALKAYASIRENRPVAIPADTRS